MSAKFAFTCCALLGAGVYTYHHLRIIPMATMHETLLWTVRSWWHRHPASGDLADWDMGPDYDDMEDLHRRELRAMDAWKFLAPFFASRGYFLYVRNLDNDPTLDAPSWPPPSSSQDYPYARILRTASHFGFPNMRLWAARDKLGRELVLKLVSTTSSPTTEFLALQRLNTPAARSDPRNHTIPVLDFVTWGGLVFAVMPRWTCAFDVRFRTLEDSMLLWEQLLEALEFCHEQRIANCDILDQNTLVNVLPGDVIGFNVLELDNKDCVKFAFIDYGFASVVPLDMALEDAPLRHNLRLHFRRGLQGRGSTCNPFEVDVLFLGALMQRHIRMVPDVFPEGIQLVERMMGLDGARVPSAAEALRDFRDIKGRMSRATLDHEFVSQRWKGGA